MNIRSKRRWALLAPLVLTVGIGAQGATASQPPDSEPHDDHSGDPHGDPHGDEVSEAGAAEGATEVHEPEPRLLAADSESGAVEVLDLVTGDPVATLEAAGPSSLYTDGRFVAAVATDDDAVTLLDGGSWVVGHGDHDHAFVKDPEVIGTYEGPRPIHTVASDGQIVVFFDGDGSAAAFHTADLVDHGAEPELTIGTSGPQHGAAIALDGHYVVSVPAATEDDLPTGVEIRHGADDVEADFSEDCPDLHGEAAFSNGVLLACDEWALWVAGGEGEWTATPIEWPEERTGSFAHTHGVSVVAGIAGDDLVTVDVDTGTATPLTAPDDEVLSAAVVNDGAEVLAITRDGTAHLIDIATDTIVATNPIVAEVDEEIAGWQPDAPKVVVSGSRAYVSDPAENTVVEIATNDELRIARTFDLTVSPGALAVVGD